MSDAGVHSDLVAALQLDLEELRMEHAEALATIREHKRRHAAFAGAPEGDVVGAEFHPEDVIDGRIVIRVAVPGDTRVSKQHVKVVPW